jgi:hypothetical protein
MNVALCLAPNETNTARSFGVRLPSRPLRLARSKERSGCQKAKVLGVAPLSRTLAVAAAIVPLPAKRRATDTAKSSLL